MSRKLPWSSSSYSKILEADLDRYTPPTDAQRIRLAAALATAMRDANMLGQKTPLNAELIRAVLTMSPEAWARDIGGIAAAWNRHFTGYDPEDPKVRFEQIQKAWGGN